jgi:hypothetical protein
VGTLRYDGESYELDDRLLFHMQIAISTKLRRGENFFLTWPVAAELGSGRHTIWVDNGVPLHIFYSGSKVPTLNKDWIEAMIQTGSRASGMHVMEESEIRPPAAR